MSSVVDPLVLTQIVKPHPADSRPAEASLRAERALSGDRAAVALSDLAVGEFATIHAVLSTDNDADRDLVLRLIEIGFVPGERVRVVAVGHPGHEPIAVRLAATTGGRRSMNGSTFAMRRHEAHFIRVVADANSSARDVADGHSSARDVADCTSSARDVADCTSSARAATDAIDPTGRK